MAFPRVAKKEPIEAKVLPSKRTHVCLPFAGSLNLRRNSQTANLIKLFKILHADWSGPKSWPRRNSLLFSEEFGNKGLTEATTTISIQFNSIR